METVMRLEAPDLVVFTGDVITGNNIDSNSTGYWFEATSVVRSLGIPWAITFGNHDDLSSGTGGTRQDLMAYDISLGSYSQMGPQTVPGVSNYYLPIYDKWSDDIMAVLWSFDSGDGSCPKSEPHCPMYVTSEQVDWYIETAKQLYSDQPSIPWAAAYMHIPLQEYMDVWNTQPCNGTNNDTVACQPVNTGLFEAFQQVGDVKMVNVGHDHGNDYCGQLQSIDLCFGRHTGYGGYGTWERGARVIEITRHKSSPTMSHSTWITFETGDRVYNQVVHQPDPSDPQTTCSI
eukprot:gene19440-23279_t